MFTKPFKLKLPTPEQALPGRAQRMPVPSTHFVNGAPLEPPTRASGRRSSAWAASGAPSRCSGRRRASSARRSAMPAASRRIRPTKKSAPAPPVTPKSCASSSIRRGQLRRSAARVLGRSRSDAGDAPGRRRRHAVPLGDLLLRRRAARRGRASRDAYQQRADARPATATSRPKSRRRRRSISPRSITSSIWRRIPNGYCGHGGTGVTCPIGG